VVTPVGGTYIQAQNVTITCETAEAQIRYTLDGSEPSTSSSLYTGAINISSSATLTAKAFKEGLDDSETVTHKYDLSFQLKLSKTFGGSDYDCLLNTIQTSDGGYIAVGSTRSNDGDISGNHGNEDGWIIKINSTGQKVWAETYGESGKDYLTDVIQTSDGNYMASGYTLSIDGIFSDNHGGQDAWIVKIDSTGNKTWSKCFGGSDEDRFKSIIKTNDNGYMAVGNTKSTDGDVSDYHNNNDGWILKLE